MTMDWQTITIDSFTNQLCRPYFWGSVITALFVCLTFTFLYYRYRIDSVKQLQHRQKLARMVLQNGWYEAEQIQDDGFFKDLPSTKAKEKISHFPKMYYYLKDGLIHINVEITMGKYQDQLLQLEKKLETEDIEAGKINCVVTKDLSRLGRNYILTGQYTEFYFPSQGVRYIAIDDGVDSEKGESEIAPFKNIINEWVARDTSRKVKFADGAHYGAYAPLGYKKDPEIKGKLLIDDDTRWIVDKIFSLASQGLGAGKITKTFHEEQVPTPAWINYQKYGTFAHIFVDKPESKRYEWSIAQVKQILKSEVYIGNSVHNKQSTVSFKDKKKIRKPESEWYRVENTHEPLVDEAVFYQVQEQIKSRRRERKTRLLKYLQVL